MFNTKMESRNEKKSLPKHYVFFVFFCGCVLKNHAGAIFFICGSESFENGRDFWRMWP
jgi:hypothetical protein